MNDILYSVIVGVVVGSVGTGFGAAISLLFKRSAVRLPYVLMAISGGIMIAVVLFDMILQAYEFSNLSITIIFLIVGAVFVALLHKLIPHYDPPQESDVNAVMNINAHSLSRTGLMICAGIAIHNLPEGLAVGSGLSDVTNFYGLDLALLLIIHNVPEGIAMGLPMHIGGIRHRYIILLAVLAGLPTALGALIGSILSGISLEFIGGSIAFAGGAMLYITLKELLPETFNVNNSVTSVLSILGGIAIGAFMVFVI